MKTQSLIKGSLILGLAGIFTRFLGLFFRWPLIMLIGDEGVGYYQMSYPLYMFFVAFASGIPVAVSKIVSERIAVGDIEGAFEANKSSMKFMLIFGTSMSLLLFLGAPYIVKILKWDPKSYYSLIGISFAPIAVSVMMVLRGFFQGFQNMNYTAVSQIIEQIGRVIIGVGFAVLFFNKGIQYSAGGAAFGAAAGGILGSGYLIYKYKKIKKEYNLKTVKKNIAIMDRFLNIAVPIAVGASVGAVMSLIDSVLVPQELLKAGLDYVTSTILYAQLTGKANVLINIPLTLSMALSVSLIPVISSNHAVKNNIEVNNKISLAMKFSAVIAIPCFLGYYFMAEPIMKLIFPGKYDGFIILKYLSISIPFIIFAQTTTAILQALDYLKVPVINMLIGCMVKIIFTSMLVPIKSINIYGAVIASILAYVVAAILNLIFLYIKTEYRCNIFENLIKPSLAAVIMILSVLFVYMKLIFITRNSIVATLISIFVGIIIYVLLLILLGVFDYDFLKERYLKRNK
ncbi:putative polysaccharide biosynthesis protein [Inconstantimicrobium mannanitabidum]|uniref:Stage V sporulation protein B n=1 Tax=Inconstantimicrobium mannanitabidum TaxID=1604901 RepID=A0ACB5RHY7_9CLOT|nr:polysaccharide biosynthesis protein [Clostridium sp. TW13]GKX68726.1 stage V sporulation protein B [Clostridium sp. TW13]